MTRADITPAAQAVLATLRGGRQLVRLRGTSYWIEEGTEGAPRHPNGVVRSLLARGLVARLDGAPGSACWTGPLVLTLEGEAVARGGIDGRQNAG